MRILVTGSTGYIGQVLTRRATRRGHDVIGLDAGWFEQCGFGSADAKPPTLCGDVRDLAAADLVGFDAIFHLAALSNDPLGALDPELTWRINHRASVALAEQAKRAGVPRLVVSSSCSVYGAAGDQPVCEAAPLAPVTAYAETKARVDQDVARLADDRFCPVFLRHATAYGISPSLRLDVVLNDLVAAAVTTRRIVLKSDGTPWRPLVHVVDIADAFLETLTAPADAVRGEAFNVGATAENYRIGELAEMIRAIVPGTTVEHAPGAGPDRRCYRVAFDKISRTLPGFVPRWNAQRGIVQLVEAFRTARLTPEEAAGPRYRRLDTLEALRAAGTLDAELRFASRSPAICLPGEPARAAAPGDRRSAR